MKTACLRRDESGGIWGGYDSDGSYADSRSARHRRLAAEAAGKEVIHSGIISTLASAFREPRTRRRSADDATTNTAKTPATDHRTEHFVKVF